MDRAEQMNQDGSRATLVSIRRALALAAAGAVAGAVCLSVLSVVKPLELALEMDRDLPGVASGFYPVELSGDETFAWTTARAGITLMGIDRRSPWACSIRLRGARPPQFPQPEVVVAADGVTLARQATTNRYQDVEVTTPIQPTASRLTLTISSTPTFVPSPSDTRALGVQIDRLVCRPAAGFTQPPRRAIAAAAVSGAAFGAMFGLLHLPVVGATIGVLLVSLSQAVPLSSGPGPFGGYVDLVARLAIWIAISTGLGFALICQLGRRQFSQTARLALAFSATALFLELLGLLHPSKQLVDAVFHAHRLEWVLSGRYYFTQPMPDGVQFPYAIALYVFAAPWSQLTRNYVLLLKIVVSVMRAVAGLALYPMVMRTWNDGRVAVLAVVLFHLLPMPFVLIGNANMTYAFGASIATLSLAAAAAWAFGWKNVLQIAAFFCVTSVAFLSHVGIFPLLLTMLLATAACYLAFGGVPLRTPALVISIATVLAAVLSVVLYYGQFGESYRSLERVRSRAVSVIAPGASVESQKSTANGAPVPDAPRTGLPLPSRGWRAGSLAVWSFGWPVLVLAACGIWRVWAAGPRNRLGLLLTGCGVAYLAFVGFAVAAPVEPRFQRYAEEFIMRINWALAPVVVVLAARGAVDAWKIGALARIAATALIGGAVAVGATAWLAWLN